MSTPERRERVARAIYAVMDATNSDPWDAVMERRARTSQYAGPEVTRAFALADAAISVLDMTEIGILDHKWLDPECAGNGCKSLLLLQRAERAEELADKYKWQVRDTCARAEKAEHALDAADARVEAMRERCAMQCQIIAEVRDRDGGWERSRQADLLFDIAKRIRALPAKGSPT